MKRGRKPNPNRPELQAKRRFWQLEKTPAVIELVRLCGDVYQQRHGKKGSVADVIRDALQNYFDHPPF